MKSLAPYVCEACRRRQPAFDPERSPGGLTEPEARMIGWSNTSRGPGWLCPLHSPDGREKLEDVALHGLGDKRSGP